MTKSEKLELGLIPVFIAGVGLLFDLPESVSNGTLILWLAALFLAQSLIRDLWILASRSSIHSAGQQKQARCFCVESSIGIAAILIGAAIVGSGVDQQVNLSQSAWVVLIMITTGLCFLIKDYVLTWPPVRIHRDPNHLNIMFRWKSDQ